jgi:23S rRNA (guanosine2251-2'-O)-methyltransferase
MKEKDLVFGIHAVTEAVRSGKEIDRLLVRKDMQGEQLRELMTLLGERNIRCQRVPPEALNRITRKNHQGVIAFIAAVTYYRLEDVIPAIFEAGKDPFIVVLDGITDVRNFGAIARTCECAGVDALVIPLKESVTVNADAMKTSAGALNVLPVCREKSVGHAIRYLRDCGVQVIAAGERAAQTYTSTDCTTPLALVLGAEDRGLSPETLRFCDATIRIPQYGTIGSLNVSVAASILIYEVVRQRNANRTDSAGGHK